MAIKKKVSAEEYAKLADHLKALYAEKEGEYILDVDGDEDTGALKRAKEHEKEQRKAAELKAKELEEKLAKMDEDGLRKRGDVEALDKSWGEKFAAREKELSEALGKKDSYIKTALVDNVARDIAHKISTSPSLIMPHIKARLVADLEGESPTTRILGVDGKISALTVDDLTKEFISNKEFAPIIVGSKASGSSATHGNIGPSGAQGGQKPNLATMKPAELAAYIEANKTA